MNDKEQPAQGGQPVAWRPIETAPASGYFLVYEDGAIRALMRHTNGSWQAPTYPALVSIVPPGMEHAEQAIVGDQAARILRPLGLRLALRDGCCENPTHWMPLPAPPGAVPQPQRRLTDEEMPPLPEAQFCSRHGEQWKTTIWPDGVVNAFPHPPRVPEDEYWTAKGYHSKPLFTATQMRAYGRAVEAKLMGGE